MNRETALCFIRRKIIEPLIAPVAGSLKMTNCSLVEVKSKSGDFLLEIAALF